MYVYMKFVIQRVSHASVTIDGEIRGKIEKGFMVLLGVTHNDTKLNNILFNTYKIPTIIVITCKGTR